MSGADDNSASQSEHDQMVLKIVREYEERDHKVYAGILGYPRPPVLGGYRPDALAVKGGHRTIVVVQTSDSFKTHHAVAKDTAFGRVQRRSPITHYERLVVQGSR